MSQRLERIRSLLSGDDSYFDCESRSDYAFWGIGMFYRHHRVLFWFFALTVPFVIFGGGFVLISLIIEWISRL